MRRNLLQRTWRSAPLVWRCQAYRKFHSSRFQFAVKPFLLADIGEGITEVQIIQWFVQPGAKVEQFDKLCEVQSDKASVEITSRFDGIIKKLHYEADDMAIVGKPLVDIDIQGEISAEDEKLTTPSEEGGSEQETSEQASSQEQEPPQQESQEKEESGKTQSSPSQQSSEKPSEGESKRSSQGLGTLATPAVRRLTKEHNVDISDVQGTGKDGRVLKEDVHNFVAVRDSGESQATPSAAAPSASASRPRELEDKTIGLTPMQGQMLKTMTKSLNIPHFLYSDTVDMNSINSLRRNMNAAGASDQKLSVLPFLIKAVSLALIEYPILNARLDTTSNPNKAQLLLRGTHNIGIAVDTPQGLLVPVIKGVQDMSVAEVAAEARRLSSLAREGKLAADDMKGGTFSVSNVGSIGGGVVAPVIVESQLAIVGVGRTKVVPAFNEDGDVIRKEECTLSWSADHRVIDGATVARCAEIVKTFMEMPESMLVKLR